MTTPDRPAPPLEQPAEELPKKEAVGQGDANQPPPEPDPPTPDTTWINSKLFAGAAGNNNTVTINAGLKADELLEDLVFAADASAPFVEYEPADEVEAHVQSLIDQRFLIIELEVLGEPRATSALYSLLARRDAQGGALKRWTGAEDLRLPIGKLIVKDYWSDAQRNSIIYLVLTDALDAVEREFNHEYAKNLSAQLREVNSYLVLVTARAPSHRTRQGSVLARAVMNCWRIASSAPEPSAAAVAFATDTFKDPVRTVVRFCATLFPGLSVTEFMDLARRLIDPMLPHGVTMTTSASAGADTQGKGEPAAAPSLARWTRGERDLLIRESGVRFGAAPEALFGQESSSIPGYYLENPAIAPLLADRFLSDSPAFLVQCLQTLTDIFFTERWSQRFQDRYLRYVGRLHSSHIHRIRIEWLVAQYKACVASPDVEYRLEQFIVMLQDAFEFDEGPDLVAGVLTALAEIGRAEEKAWARQLSVSRFPDALSHHKRLSDDGYGAAWDALGAVQLQEEYLRVTRQLEFIFSVVLSLATASPHASVQALLAVLEGPDIRAEFSDLAEGVPKASPWFLTSNFAFTRFIAWIARGNPRGFVSCVSVISGSIPDARARLSRETRVVADPYGNAEMRRAAARETLLNSCVRALEGLVEVDLGKPLPKDVADALLPAGKCRHSGQVVASCLASRPRGTTAPKGLAFRSEDEVVDVHGIVRFYERVCRALLAEEPADPSLALRTVVEFMTPLLEMITARERIRVAERARELERGYRGRQQFFVRIGERSSERCEGRRMRAIYLFMRALGAATQAAIGTSQQGDVSHARTQA